MRKIFLSVSCLAVILTLTLCSTQINAQVPAISKKYSEQKVYELIMRYNTSNKYNGAANAAVSKAFGRDFPNAYDIEWETNDEIYEVEFEIRNRDFKAYYDKEGNLIIYKQDITVAELPANVNKAIKALYPKYRLDDVDKIVSTNQTYYKVELEYGEHETTIYVDSKGKQLDNVPLY